MRKLCLAVLLLFLVGCSDQPVMVESPLFSEGWGAADGDVDPALQLTHMLDVVNAALAEQGLEYRAAMVEYLTGAGDAAGAEVISKYVGNKQLEHDFVPFDSRRAWSGSLTGTDDDITYAVDQTLDAVPPFGGLSAAQTDAAIDRAMATWDGQTCSHLPITQNPDYGIDIGVIAYQYGFGGSGYILADVQHAGWRDINFGGGVIGATFTFVFIDGSGNPTDIDNNGKQDVAFREIYYDPSFSWADDGATDVDVEAVALHEMGHGLSQAHFGNIFFMNDGSVKRAPAAVMNSYLLGQTRTLLGTDVGGHCANWGPWPSY
jgi:hypothetical protein